MNGLALNHPAWCTGGPCSSASYPDGAREEVHERELPVVPGTGDVRVWVSAFRGLAADGTVQHRADVVGIDGPAAGLTPEQAEQLGRDLIEAARLLRARTPAGAR